MLTSIIFFSSSLRLFSSLVRFFFLRSKALWDLVLTRWASARASSKDRSIPPVSYNQMYPIESTYLNYVHVIFLYELFFTSYFIVILLRLTNQYEGQCPIESYCSQFNVFTEHIIYSNINVWPYLFFFPTLLFLD